MTKQLETWLSNKGANLSLVQISKNENNERSVICQQNINKGTTILKIPLACLICVEMGEKCPIGCKLKPFEDSLKSAQHTYLAIFILWDRKYGHEFQPYYESLPDCLDHIPVMWDPNTLEKLKGSSMQRMIQVRIQTVKHDYGLICSAAPEFNEFSFTEFLWARTIVTSRNFSTKIGNIKTSVMVPFADMLNHKRPRETIWGFKDENCTFTITALNDLKKGEEVHDSYGIKCNRRFLLSYGFAIEENSDIDGRSHNECLITVELDPLDPLYPIKLAFLGGERSIRSVRLSENYYDVGTMTVFSFLRFAVATQDELQRLDAFVASKATVPVPPLSIENEIRVLKAVLKSCEEAQEKYPTSLKQDEESLLHATGVDRQILLLLVGEKKILAYYVQFVPYMINLLERREALVCGGKYKKYTEKVVVALCDT